MTPGYLFDGFGNPQRTDVVHAGFEHAIDSLDVTIEDLVWDEELEITGK